MPINIPSVFPPLKWTKKSWIAYEVWHKASMEYVSAYHATIGIFALFSPKKNRALKEAQANYREALDNYNRVFWGEAEQSIK